jgi:hypothetical protein
MSEKELLPIPQQVLQHHKRSQARAAVDKMQLENMLLKHLVDTLDPEHDYQFNNETLELEKVKKDVPKEYDLQLGDNQDSSGREEGDPDGKAEELGGPLGLGSIAGAQAAHKPAEEESDTEGS